MPGPRAAVNKIGDEGAKELAAALKANSTLTMLYLERACRGAALPTHTPQYRRTRMHACRRGVRRASPERTPHARPPRPHRACARPRAADNRIGDEGAKELATALKAYSTLTNLNLGCACRGAPLPTPLAAPPHAHARVQEGPCGAPAPSARRTRARRAHTARAPAPVLQAMGSRTKLLWPPSRASSKPRRLGRPHRCAMCLRPRPQPVICRAAWTSDSLRIRLPTLPPPVPEPLPHHHL